MPTMPKFPEFAAVNLGSSPFIIDHTNQFNPYSDFNFISLWSWDTNSERKFSILNDNLVILFTDYTTDEPFLSVLGNNRIDDTVTTLLNYCVENGLPDELRLVPESTAKHLSDSFTISEDEENFDYVFSTKAISNYAGNRYKNKRQLANKFATAYPDAKVVQESASSPEAQVRIFTLLKTWADNKVEERKELDLKNEQKAILRALKAADNDLKILLTTLNIDDEIIAFSIDEIVSHDYAISHFFKTDHSHQGCTEYFNSALAENLHNSGIEHWNWEQDLGLNNLRDVKQRYRPVSFLKKFIVSNV